MISKRVTLETEETNITETPKIHYRDFLFESGNTEAWTVEIVFPSEGVGRGLFSPLIISS